jgi:hypothetical protein
MSKVRPLLRLLAVVACLGPLAWWTAAGAHRGWSMDRVPVTQIDEITEIEYITYEDRFVPGLDVLLIGNAAALLLIGASFFFRPSAAQSIQP